MGLKTDDHVGTWCATIDSSLGVFEPGFVIEGVQFTAAGAATLTTTRARRRWTAGCLAATGFATLTGLFGLRV